VGQIVQSASEPSLIDTRMRTLLLALFVGLSLGVGLALFAERFDDRLRGRQDLAARSAAPVLATIPRLRSWKDGEPVVATLSAPRSETSEAYRTLRTGVLYAATHNRVKTILVTSSEGGEGKTTTVANLAAVLGKAGKRVIVIVADLRRPRLERFFGMGDGASSGAEPPPLGLTNVLAGEVNVEEALVPVPDLPNVRILRSGPMAGNPAELLESSGMRDVVARLRDQADFILIDAAPVLGVYDALVLCRLADAVLLVADAGRTRRTTVDRAREQLMQVNGKLIGSVLNNLDAKKAEAYGDQ
jgi:capsular exopolysaccharide synthesis family protein